MNDSLGDRMKRYEYVTRSSLMRRTPAIIRIDGKAFHTFTSGMKKPFDAVLMNAIQDTMRYLCENIQGCVFGYTQSDEISLLVKDYETIETEAWFDYSVQKMCSVTASMATMSFNRFFAKMINVMQEAINESWNVTREEEQYCEMLMKKIHSAMFDARVFSLPREEVCNYFIWRQNDATRNSISSAAQSMFSHKQLHGKKSAQMQEMMWSERGVNWNDYPADFKRGACCYKVEQVQSPLDWSDGIKCRFWKIDKEPPIFTQDRNYVEVWV